MFNINEIQASKKTLVMVCGFCLFSGFIVGKITTPIKTTTNTKNVSIDKLSSENKEEKINSVSSSKDNKTTESQTRNNIVTTTKIHHADGTVIETTVTDNSIHSLNSADLLTSSLVKLEEKAEQSKTTEHATTKETSKTVDSTTSGGIFSFAGGISMKGDGLGIVEKGFSPSLQDVGGSVEVKVWRVGLQAQGFGDGTVIGTVKLWIN